MAAAAIGPTNRLLRLMITFKWVFQSAIAPLESFAAGIQLIGCLPLFSNYELESLPPLEASGAPTQLLDLSEAK